MSTYIGSESQKENAERENSVLLMDGRAFLMVDRSKPSVA